MQKAYSTEKYQTGRTDNIEIVQNMQHKTIEYTTHNTG